MNRSEGSQLLPITVLTGFLGSGKTTVLNRLIQHPDFRRTLVLINEFGEIGLDHDLVTHSADDVVIEMASGCVCCTIRGDLAATLRQAPHRFARDGKPWFDRVVLETTGLADPAPILQTLMTEPTVAKRYRLDGVVTTIDAANASDTLDRQVESVKQVAVADRLLITKVDLVDDADQRLLQARLTGLNPSAPQVIASAATVDPDLLFSVGGYDPRTKSLDVAHWLRAEAFADTHSQHGHGHTHNDPNRHDDHISAFCLTVTEPVRSEALDAFLDALLVLRGADLLRVKGIVNVVDRDGPVVVHGVQHVFHPKVELDEWPSDDHRSRMVFITRDIDPETLRRTFDAFADTSALAHALDSV